MHKFGQRLVGSAVVMALGLVICGCPGVGLTPGTPTDAFTNADVVRGGALYDKWWTVAEVAEPTGDHPLWAGRPDVDSNTRTGLDTWRCKECHGWDYKGVDGAYATGSHRTGIAGIFGTTMSAQEVFDLLGAGDHGFSAAGLSDADIWDLAKFVLEGQIDTGDIIDADNAFTGDTTSGQTLYDDGIGGNTACAQCHGAEGRDIPFHPEPDEEFVGTLAVDNPWEFQHKVRFGQPGEAMPAAVNVGASLQDIADVGAYAQTLPQTSQ
ncbi:MAG: c-type cytochrome [Phycisphaerae bacterium]